MGFAKNNLALRGILVPFRISSGKNQPEFALENGFPVGTWQAWEQGRYQPNFKELVKLCEKFPGIAKEIANTILPSVIPRYSEEQLKVMAKQSKAKPKKVSTNVKAGVLG